MASHRIGPRVLNNTLAKTRMWTPSMGFRVWLRLPVEFRHWMIAFPVPRTHPSCIGCALPIICFPIVSAGCGGASAGAHGVQRGTTGGAGGRHTPSGHQAAGDGADQVQATNHRDGSANAARLAAKEGGGREGRGGMRGRRAEGAPDGPQREENPADMRTGRMNGVASRGDSWGCRGPEGRMTQCHPSLGLEHPGGAHRGTERTPALSRPRGSGSGRGSELMAHRGPRAGD